MPSGGTGSLISIHSHNNIDVLNELFEQDNKLAYKGKKISAEYTDQEVTDMVNSVWEKIEGGTG